MVKKLILCACLFVVLIFSSISIYADQEESIPGIIKNHTVETVIPAMEETTVIAQDIAEKKAAQKKKEQEEKYLKGLSAYIRHVNRNVPVEEAETMAKSFVKYAKKYDVDEKVVMAIAQNESTYYSDAVSCENFKGLMQTGDGLAKNAGYDPQQLFDPEISIKVGARYLSIKLDEFGDITLALTAYNQGSGSVHSGNYSTGYAELAMARAAAVDDFLTQNGYY